MEKTKKKRVTKSGKPKSKPKTKAASPTKDKQGGVGASAGNNNISTLAPTLFPPSQVSNFTEGDELCGVCVEPVSDCACPKGEVTGAVVESVDLDAKEITVKPVEPSEKSVRPNHALAEKRRRLLRGRR